jgi:hypothetical protein
MKLPQIAADANPDFVDAVTCKEWLQNVPLANVGAAQQYLHYQLDVFNTFGIDAGGRLAVMETLREAVHFVQIEQAKRFTNRALPMTEAEASAFDATIGLWEQMRVGYLHCLQAALEGGGVRSKAGLICQRALAYAGLKMFHHYRAYREVPASQWGELNQVFGHALELDVAEDAVKDFLNRDIHDTSPRVAFTRAALMGMCNPNELPQRQLTFVAYLLERWGSKIETSEKPVAEEEGVAMLAVDLGGESPPERVDDAGAMKKPLYLDTRKLAKSLRNRVALLRKGESPAKLALGEDCVQPSCEQVLVFLYRQWCQDKPTRAERRAAKLKAQVCNGMPAIHYYVGGEAFKQPTPKAPTELTQKQREEIATFGRISTRDQEEYSDAQGYLLEQWQIVDENAQGLRVLRAGDVAGARYAHGQLVAVRPQDAKQFMLAQARWLMAGDGGELHAGLKVLPGVPSPVSVRGTGLNTERDEYVQAIFLSAVQALSAPPTLVLPSGWFKPKRVIEVVSGDTSAKVQLNEVVERGTDFERVAYETA